MIPANLIGKLSRDKTVSEQLFDREVKSSKHIPLRYFATPEIFTTKQGALGAVISLAGLAFEVKDHSELNQLQQSFAFALQSLGDDYAVYITSHRHQAITDLEGNYPEGFANDFYQAYSAQFNSASLFVNDMYLTIILKAGDTTIKKGLNFVERLQVRPNKEGFLRHMEKQQQKFKTALTNLLVQLRAYSPKLLGENRIENGLPEAEPLRLFSIVLNGEEGRLTYPHQDIARFIATKRLFFGTDTIHFKGNGNGKEDNYFAAILSIKTYAAKTNPGYLNSLLCVPFPIISTHSFLTLEKNQALKIIDTQLKRLISTKDAAYSQLDELTIAKDDVMSGRISFGYHHNTVMVIAGTLDALEKNVAEVIKCYKDQRLAVVRETLNLESAFWAQLPGNFRYIKRKSMISSTNFSCFCSLHNYTSGYRHQNHLGGALMLVETRSRTPFYFNIHEKASGKKNDLSKGHTTIIAPSNAGKTVIMTAIDCFFQKYGVTSFFFDRQRGCEVYVRAMGGQYHCLMPGEITGWNPCQLSDTPKNRKFLRDFIEVLATTDTQLLSATDVNQIAEVVDRNFSLLFEKRNLSTITSFFRLDFNGLSALSRYVRLPDRTGRSGDRAYLFDNDADTLNFNAKTMGFDLTHWLSDTSEKNDELLPISMYLFHRIESCLDGRLVNVYFDEGQQILNHPYWENKIDDWLVTWRKLNANLLFGTQFIDKIAKSKLASPLIQGSATNIFLANPKAQEQDYIESFKLTPREFDIVKTLVPQERYFLVKQNHESAIVRINLFGLEKYVAVLSGNITSVDYCETLRAERGDEPSTWLPAFYERFSA